jgi:hypothetical protein
MGLEKEERKMEPGDVAMYHPPVAGNVTGAEGADATR